MHLLSKITRVSTLVFSLLGAAYPLFGQKYELPSAQTAVPINGNTEILRQMSQAVSSIAETSRKALVFVSVSKTMKNAPLMIDPFEFFFGPGPGGPSAPQRERPKQEGLGSGFFIDLSKGYLLTNNHVIEGADTISLKLANGEVHDGKVIGRDANTDIAVVEVVGDFKKEGLSALVLGDSDAILPGSFVLALGAPFGLESSTSFGVISAIGRGNLQITRLGDFIQTDAAINPGNSGGPLISMDGKVIGINTAIASRSGAYNGVGFTVPSNLVRNVAASLINDGSVQRGYIGVYFDPLREDWVDSLKLPKNTVGSIISKVAPGGPADKAGLESGDVIITINNRTLKDGEELVNIIGFMKPGDKAHVQYYRQGKKQDTTIVIGAYPGAESLAAAGEPGAKASNPYGITATPLTEALRREYQIESHAGLVITNVTENSPAQRAMLRSGDVILAVNGKKVTNQQALDSILKNEKKMVLLHVERQGAMYFLSLKRSDANG